MALDGSKGKGEWPKRATEGKDEIHKNSNTTRKQKKLEMKLMKTKRENLNRTKTMTIRNRCSILSFFIIKESEIFGWNEDCLFPNVKAGLYNTDMFGKLTS